MERTVDQQMKVLHVDDDPSLLAVAGRLLERADPAFDVTSAESADEGLDVLASEDVDCIVSDYEMPGTDGLAFLRAVRENHPNLPFVLFTGQGSEGVASDAISAGVTDYVRKHAADPYATLANRLRNAVQRRRTEAELDRLRQRHSMAAAASTDAFVEWVPREDTVRWGEGFLDAFGYDAAAVETDAAWWHDHVHPDDRDEVLEAVESAAEDGGELEVRCRFRRADGEYAHVVARGSAVEGSGRVVGALVDVTERVEHERKLESLHGATRSLLRAGTEEAVAEAVVDAASSVLELPAVVVRLFDDESNVLRPAARSADAVDIVGEPTTFEAGESIAWDAFAAGEPQVYDDVRAADSVYDPETPLRSTMVFPLGDHGVVTAASTSAGAFDEATQDLAAILVDGARAALDRTERTSDLAEQDRKLRKKAARLDRVVELNEATRDVQARLADADDRRGVERDLCRRLVDLDRFAFAWVGSADEPPSVRASAGSDAGYLDAVFGEASDGVDDTVEEPAARCARSEDPVAVDSIGDGVQGSDWRRAALERGFHAAMSVPLVRDDRAFGVLTVYGATPGSFDDLTRDGLAALARTVTQGIDAIETRHSLQADTAVELELSVTAPTDLLQTLARETGTTATLEGSVPASDEQFRLFVSVPEAATDEIREALAGTAAELAGTVDGEEPLYELLTDGSSVTAWFVDRGAVPRETTATPGEIHTVVRLPGAVDVRSLVETVRSRYSDAELLARRDVERPVGDGEPSTAALSELTERQAEVLRTAYYSGYFEWPRRRSGEEVADALDIAQPTFHRHLRACHRRVLDAVLERGADPSRTRKP